jgi:hypothetical protein
LSILIRRLKNNTSSLLQQSTYNRKFKIDKPCSIRARVGKNKQRLEAVAIAVKDWKPWAGKLLHWQEQVAQGPKLHSDLYTGKQENSKNIWQRENRRNRQVWPAPSALAGNRAGTQWEYWPCSWLPAGNRAGTQRACAGQTRRCTRPGLSQRQLNRALPTARKQATNKRKLWRARETTYEQHKNTRAKNRFPAGAGTCARPGSRGSKAISRGVTQLTAKLMRAAHKIWEAKQIEAWARLPSTQIEGTRSTNPGKQIEQETPAATEKTLTGTWGLVL